MRDILNNVDLPYHPTAKYPGTEEPLRAIGWTSRGPVWPIIGGDGTDDGGGSDDDSGGSGSGDGGSGSDDSGGNSGSGGNSSGEGDVNSLPDWAQKFIRNLRGDAAKARTTAKQKAADDARNGVLQDIAKALGLNKDADTDPETLKQQIGAKDSRIRELETREAVRDAAAKHGADVTALLDSNSFLKKLADLDSADGDYASQVDAVVKEAAEDPKYKAGGLAPPRKSGGEFTGGSGDGASITDAELARMSPEQIAKAYNDGKLKHLL